MSRELDHEKTYSEILKYQEKEHIRNQKRIRWGIRCVILVPMIFLVLMFSMDSSKSVYLVLWIISLFVISGFLIYVEYTDYNMQKKLTELGIREEEKIDQLLPESSIEARLLELENKIAADRLLLEQFMKENELKLPDDKGKQQLTSEQATQENETGNEKEETQE